MGTRARIGLIAGAMVVAIAGRGCVTTPPPNAESVVAGSPKTGAHASSHLGAGGAAAPDSPAPSLPSTSAPSLPNTPAPSLPNAPTLPATAPHDSIADSAQSAPGRVTGLGDQQDDAAGRASTASSIGGSEDGRTTVARATTMGAIVPGAPAGSSAAQTSDERRAALDRQLDLSLGAFDAKLHKEQQKTAEERDARQATVSSGAAAAAAAAAIATGSAGEDGSGSATAANPAAPLGAGSASGAASGAGSDSAVGAAPAAASGSAASAAEVPGKHRGTRGDTQHSRAGDLKSDKGSGGATSASGNGALATIIPDGNDDDVVARRLRKAAELETDPELKEKLWKEYVEYKKNTQVR